MKIFRLIISGILFAGLTLLGIVWAIWYYDIGSSLFPQLVTLSASTLFILLAFYLALYITDVWRYQVLGAAVNHPVRFITALESSIANDLFSWVTPGTGLGMPAAIYVMGRRGIAWDAASLVCFGKSMIGSAVILLATFLLLLSGMNHQLSTTLTMVLLWGLGVVLLVIMVPIIAAMRHTQSLALIQWINLKLAQNTWLGTGRIYVFITKLLRVCSNAISRLHKLKARGLLWGAAVTLIHIPYMLVFSGMLWVVLLHYGAPLSGESAGVSIVYLGFTHVAPTPGASGLSEASAYSFFGDFLDPVKALAAVFIV